MLAIARALLIYPRLLVLDEPSQGLAPLIVRELLAVIAAARDTGLSVLLVEQNVRAAVEIADRAYVLDDGRVVYEGPAAELAADEARVRAPAPRPGLRSDCGFDQREIRARLRVRAALYSFCVRCSARASSAGQGAGTLKSTMDRATDCWRLTPARRSDPNAETAEPFPRPDPAP
jgi:ABC-type multidrug transport system ATPase subunit